MRRWICVIRYKDETEFSFLDKYIDGNYSVSKNRALILDHPEIPEGAKNFVSAQQHEIVPFGFNPNGRTNPSWKRKMEKYSGDDDRSFYDGLVHARLWISNAKRNGIGVILNKHGYFDGEQSKLFDLVCDHFDKLLTKEINEHAVELAPDEKWVKIKIGAPVNTPAGGDVLMADQFFAQATPDPVKPVLTKEDMPDHPRYAFDTEIAFTTDERGSQYISKLKPRELESACSIAYRHFMEKAKTKSGSAQIPDVESAMKWISIPKPLVFGKDWNGWEFNDGTISHITFHPQERPPYIWSDDEAKKRGWKRVLRTSKVIE